MSRDVSISFAGEMQDLKSSLDGMRGDIESWGKQVSAIGVGALAAWASAKAFDIISDGLREVIGLAQEFAAIAAEAAQVDAKLESVLTATGNAAGFTADELKGLASDLQSITTYGDETIKTAQTMLLRFKEIKGDEFTRATALAADMATVLGGDLSAAADQLGKALSNPERGLMLLERQGVKFTESQKRAIQSMIEGGRVAEAQAAIMSELETVYGGAAQAAANASGGGLLQLQEIIGDIKEEIGAKLLPIADQMVPTFKFIASEIGDALIGLMDDFGALGLEIAAAFDAKGPAESLLVVLAQLANQLQRVMLNTKEAYLATKTFLEIDDLEKVLLPSIFGVSEMTDTEKALIRTREELESLLSPSEAVAAALADFRNFKTDSAEREQEARDTFAFDKEVVPAFDMSGLPKSLEGVMGMGKDLLGTPFAQEMQRMGASLADTLAESLGGAAGGLGKGLFDLIDGKSGEDGELEQSFAQSNEGLQDLFHRIQGSAASTGGSVAEKQLEVAKATKDATEAIPFKLDVAIEWLRQMASAPGAPQVAVLGP